MIRPGPLSAADASFLNEKMRELEYLLRREESRLGQQAEIFPAAITSNTTLSWTTNTTFTTVLTGTTVTTLTTVTSLTAMQHGWYEEAFTDIGTRVTMIGGRTGSNLVDVARMPDGSALAATPTSPVHVWMRRTGLGVTSGVNHEVVSMAGSDQLGFARFSLSSTITTTLTSVTSCTVDGSWGPAAVTIGSKITVWNLPASSNFIFQGAGGNKGLATYDATTGKWWIVQLQCP